MNRNKTWGGQLKRKYPTHLSTLNWHVFIVGLVIETDFNGFEKFPFEPCFARMFLQIGSKNRPLQLGYVLVIECFYKGMFMVSIADRGNPSNMEIVGVTYKLGSKRSSMHQYQNVVGKTERWWLGTNDDIVYVIIAVNR